jgi:hypothetical protein
MTIQGTFPEARYMSFTLYVAGEPVKGGNLYDAEIQPSAGSDNPFQPGASATGTYSLQVVDAAQPAEPAPNTLYTGSPGPGLIRIIYRIYDPIDPGDPAGDVPLPQTTITLNGTPLTVNQPCVGSPFGSQTNQLQHFARPQAAKYRRHADAVSPPRRDRSHQVRRALAAPQPTWVVADPPSIYANPDTAYLGASIDELFGQLVVLQAQMPTFPDTNEDQPAWEPGQQVRYWSICEDEGLFEVVVACSADFDSVQDGGVATFVISSPSNRPANATAAGGVNWLPWGSSFDGHILYRQMLAQPSFSQAIANVPAGSPPSTTMGPYLPEIAYCSEAEFAASGAAGCLAGAAPVR